MKSTPVHGGFSICTFAGRIWNFKLWRRNQHRMITIAKRITDSIPDSPDEVTTEEKADKRSGQTDPASLGFSDIVVFLYNVLFLLFESIVKLALPPQERDLHGDIILVTGSGHGIGRELVLRFAKEGAVVILWDRDGEANAETLAILKSQGYSKAHAYTVDVSDRAEVLAAAKRVEVEVGPVSVVVNNAAVARARPVVDQTEKDIRQVFEVNVLSHFWTLEAFLPSMLVRNQGHVVAICSMTGLIALPYAVPYSSSKFAVRGLMESIEEEFRSRDPKCQIKFSTVYPSAVDTGLFMPKARFVPVLKPEEVASEVVRTVRQGLREICIPQTLFLCDRISRLLPVKLVQYVRDFCGDGIYVEQ